jgi:uncharacterized membrane protein
MGKGRIEAFSDGVLAIIITIMVLELKVPHGSELKDLLPLWPIALSYLLSFINVGIYWNNHHHMFQAVKSIGGNVLWANLGLLFWLSLVPFTTDWMGENHFDTIPVVLYGVVLLLCGVSYYVLVSALRRHHGPDSSFSRAIGRDHKGILSTVAYAVALPLAFLSPYIALAIYFAVALVWLVPDRRFERELHH